VAVIIKPKQGQTRIVCSTEEASEAGATGDWILSLQRLPLLKTAIGLPAITPYSPMFHFCLMAQKKEFPLAGL
jgi:hypothetical protein